METLLNEGKLLILTKEETMQLTPDYPYWTDFTRLLDDAQLHFSKAEMYAEAVIGELVYMDHTKNRREQNVIVYQLRRDELLLVEMRPEMQTLENLLPPIMTDQPQLNPIRLFTQLLNAIVKNDLKYLLEIEASCYHIEEELLLDHDDLNPSADIARFRKALLTKNFRYQQLGDLIDTLLENPFDFFTNKEKVHFQSFDNKVNRLSQHTQMLREYLIQLREMYQQKMESHQNATMQLLTVVTTIFFPLTLIAGWYGMNFDNMPELHHPLSYLIVIIVCLIIVVAEIIFFKKKKFL